MLFLIAFILLSTLVTFYAYYKTIEACSGDKENNIPVYAENDIESNSLTIVFGWGACQMKHLSRILNVYQEKGMNTLAYTSPMELFLAQGIASRTLFPLLKKLDSILKKVPEDRRKDYKIYVHCFSNTGAITFAKFFNMISNDSHFNHITPHLAGLIFDSAPIVFVLRDMLKVPESLTNEMKAFDKFIEFPPLAGPADIKVSDEIKDLTSPYLIFKYAFEMSFAIVATILKRNQYFHWFWTPASTLCISSVFAFSALRRALRKLVCKLGIISTQKARESFHLFTNSYVDYHRDYSDIHSDYKNINHDKVFTLYEALYSFVRHPYKLPILFMYSDNDILCREDDTERVMYCLMSSKSRVFQYKFKRSAHVQHLLKFPAEYKGALYQFLDTISTDN